MGILLIVLMIIRSVRSRDSCSSDRVPDDDDDHASTSMRLHRAIRRSPLHFRSREWRCAPSTRDLYYRSLVLLLSPLISFSQIELTRGTTAAATAYEYTDVLIELKRVQSKKKKKRKKNGTVNMPTGFLFH